MSRKATERRSTADAFVEANLWVVTRGRKFKPRFRAERAVVIVSGGGAARADAQVAPPRTVHGRRAAARRERRTREERAPRSAARCRGRGDGALRGHRVRRGRRLDSAPARRQTRRAGVAYPLREPRSTARLLKKLLGRAARGERRGRRDAAQGARPSGGEHKNAIVLQYTGVHPAPLPCSPASGAAAGDGARAYAGRTSASGTCRRNTATRVFRTTSARPCGASWPRRSRTPARAGPADG